MALEALFTFPHFIWISIGLFFCTIAIVMVMLHKPSNWLLLHKIFAALGVFIIILGVIILGGLILNIPHGVIGLISIILYPGTLVNGLIAIRKKRKEIRSTHIWLSRIVYLLSILVLILGLQYFI